MAISEKHLDTLEYPKVLAALAELTAFSASTALAQALRPTTDVGLARRWQLETAEAWQLLASRPDTTVGGARDVRPAVARAARGATLDVDEIMQVKSTILAGKTLKRRLSKQADEFPTLAGMAWQIDNAPGIVEQIDQTLDERGEVLDSASPRLGSLRQQIKTTHSRLQQKLQGIINNADNAIYLQEALVTQRSGRYVIPLKAQYKGRIKGITHDKSSSGATLFIEPMATVELNNQYSELQFEEREEVRRVLAALSAIIGERAEQLAESVEALALLDFTFAKAKYAERLRATPPTFVEWRQPARIHKEQTSALHPGSYLHLRAVRHPLLNQETVVPIDVVLDDDTFIVVVTGPNTGGKTVALKTIGLTVLMAQSGLQVAAKSGAELTTFDGVFADIGDEQSIEQSLSTFSAHITNIIGILEACDARSLVLLDELGAGTDPEEGSGLARALLNYLVDQGATTFATTHYSQLKLFAHQAAGIANANVEFNVETLAPTYHLSIGLPGRSHALEVAARLGLDSTIVADARRNVTLADQQADALLADITRKHKLTEAQLNLAQEVKKDTLKLEEQLIARLEGIDQERREVLHEAHQTAERELDDLRREVRRLRHRLQAAGMPVEQMQEIMAEADSLEEEAAEALTPTAAYAEDDDLLPEADELRLGDKVWVATLRTEGQIVTLGERDVEVQVGRLRLRTTRDELARQTAKPAPTRPVWERPKPPKPVPASKPQPPPKPSPGMELDLRGERVETGLEQLERYLDAAYLARLPWVRIIHGKGTGRLRAAVREALAANPQVISFKSGDAKEGGEGVTIATLEE